MIKLEQLKYPIGGFKYAQDADITYCISRLERLPNELKELVGNLNEKALNWKYRPEGWKIFQVVHHISDSHINAYTRMKVAYTENGKSITAYNENAWSKLIDVQTIDLRDTLSIIFLVHKRLVTFLRSLSEEEWNRAYYHAEDKVLVTLHEAVQMYAWHGDHHLAHIRQGLDAKGAY